MDNERHIQAAADRIVQWAALHPLSAQETETRYAHLLKGLSQLEEGIKVERDLRARWSAFDLGRLVVRYWRDRVEDISESLGAGAFAPLAAARGAATDTVALPPERTLKADGRSGIACVKLTAGLDQVTLDLVLWLEPKSTGADLPFTVTVLDSAKTQIGRPTPCAARNLIRYRSIAPAQEYTLIFETADERWEIRWGFSSATDTPAREPANQ